MATCNLLVHVCLHSTSVQALEVPVSNGLGIVFTQVSQFDGLRFVGVCACVRARMLKAFPFIFQGEINARVPRYFSLSRLRS